MKIAISSGHGKYVRGASGLIDEVDEARKVVPMVAKFVREQGASVVTFNDDTSTTQSENLETIVDWTNQTGADLAVSVHFNSYDGQAHGTEVLWVTQEDLASKVAEAISAVSDLTDRGAKERTDLYFLNNTDMPAILIEVCFVDSEEDVSLYEKHFEGICEAIAGVIANRDAIA